MEGKIPVIEAYSPVGQVYLPIPCFHATPNAIVRFLVSSLILLSLVLAELLEFDGGFLHFQSSILRFVIATRTFLRLVVLFLRRRKIWKR